MMSVERTLQNAVTVCAVLGCDDTGTENRRFPGFDADEYLCADHAAWYDGCDEPAQFVQDRCMY